MVIITTIRDSKNGLHVFMENTQTYKLLWVSPDSEIEGIGPNTMGIYGDSAGRIIDRTLQALIETSPKYVSVEITK